MTGDRRVSAHLDVGVMETADLVLAIAVDRGYRRLDEQLLVSVDGTPLETSMQDQLIFIKGAPPGNLLIDYRATVVGATSPAPATDVAIFRYMCPSRYCESDRLGPLARDEFDGLSGAELLASLTAWVHENIDYVAGSSRPTDGAVATLLGRKGVCRDFAHLTAAMLRANNIAARVASVYAPGLEPMDFHAVTEACIDGAWYVVDSTALAPRQSMVRIATGSDASEVAFLTTLRGVTELNNVVVTAVVDGDLPFDDHTGPASIS